MLESGKPPGLDRIRRFVVKPRPRLWKLGVGIWLWIVQIARWLGSFLKWTGGLAVRLARAARLSAFLGRRAQNFGARIGAVGRNWSSAEGRLGAAGGRLTRFGGQLVGGGATLAQVGEGVTELTNRAARFLADAQGSGGGPPTPEKDSPTGKPPSSRSKRSRRRAAVSTPGTRQPAARSGASSIRAADGSPSADEPPAGGTVSTEPPPEQQPSAPAAAEPSPLPDDLPFYLRNQIEHLGGRPRRETVERLILEVTELRGWMEPAELAAWFGTTPPYLTRRYLGPMAKAGLLVRLYPNRPTHPDQAYRSARVAAREAEPQG